VRVRVRCPCLYPTPVPRSDASKKFAAHMLGARTAELRGSASLHVDVSLHAPAVSISRTMGGVAADAVAGAASLQLLVEVSVSRTMGECRTLGRCSLPAAAVALTHSPRGVGIRARVSYAAEQRLLSVAVGDWPQPVLSVRPPDPPSLSRYPLCGILRVDV
jgi:hypothetical protein